MARESANHGVMLILENDQPLIAVPFGEADHEAACYFAEDRPAESATANRITREALGVLGAWADLDWDEMEHALDRIRHESVPTPPIEL